MRIAIVNNDFGMGGIQRVTTVIGKELAKKNHVYFYSMFSGENFYQINQNFIDGRIWADRSRLIKKIYRSRKLIEQLSASGEYTPSKYVKRNLNKLIKFTKENNIDCLILSGPDFTSFIPYIKKELPELVLIAWQHNNANSYLNKYAKPFKTAYLNGLREASHVICLTNSDYNIYREFTSNITQIYNPVTIKNDKVSTLTNNIISFVGRIDIQHKGIDYLVEIASKLPDGWKISVAGSGDKQAMQELDKLLRKYDAKGKIIFYGNLKGENLQQHYLKSSFYLMTSRWEGFGLVLTEAMSFGLPIVSFKNSGSDEILEYGKYGLLIENGDIDKIMEKIYKLIENTSLRRTYQHKSLERIKDFSLDKVIEKWREVLIEVSNG